MYNIVKRLEIAGAHNLKLDYESKWSNIHGHDWVVTIYVRSKELDDNGMVLDFTHIKKLIHDKLDHKYLNEIFDFNPTAENISKWISDELTNYMNGKGECYKVSVQESEGNICIYERD